MALNDSTRKPKQDRSAEPDPALLRHIQSLGHSTVEDYLSWCAQHGFSRRIDKHWKVRLKERAFVNRTIADARLAQKKHELRKPVPGEKHLGILRRWAEQARLRLAAHV